MAKSDEDWDESEIRVCVDQYVNVLRLGGGKANGCQRHIFGPRGEAASKAKCRIGLAQNV